MRRELQSGNIADRLEKAAAKAAEKDSNDLDAVAGNAEDDIGELIAGIKEKELLYGEKSLLAVYGPMIAHICASPKKYRVSTATRREFTRMVWLTELSLLRCDKLLFCPSASSCASRHSSASSTWSYCSRSLRRHEIRSYGPTLSSRSAISLYVLAR